MFQLNSPNCQIFFDKQLLGCGKQNYLKLFSRRITYIAQKLQILIPAYAIKICLRNKKVIQRFMLARKYRKLCREASFPFCFTKPRCSLGFDLLFNFLPPNDSTNLCTNDGKLVKDLLFYHYDFNIISSNCST